ncbi:hypothetical protein HNQ64_002696 [Prosthecobacter dejongeii]|uniref:Uncharacterized protein n=1 Tax=Prosthecobacter dejongeii TaxID=48465 RepID=A0A7W8DQF8_9BACT|nr:hypothetical protein [Prosthecobacter dejongeii]
MIHEIYSLSEEACRNFPDSIPGRPGMRIEASGPFRPNGDEATASTFVFNRGRRKIVFQSIPPPLPASEVGGSRDLLFSLLYERRISGDWFDRDLREVKAMLRRMGATLLGCGHDCYEAEIARRRAFFGENSASTNNL